MTLKDDLLSDDISVVLNGLRDLDVRLRAKEDMSDLLDILLKLSSSDLHEAVEKVTWCAAKMGQNKINDDRIVTLLVGMAENNDPQVRENVAWGLGETAGTVAMSDVAMSTISLLLDDGESSVRGTAAWAAGRFHHKCGHMTADIRKKLNVLVNDTSEFVRSAAVSALERS
ncbi:MAG: HEAT repeat domain-containing protein [Methanomassiliicoccaceae archaeon]|nr:HEAT repeat domain-containing protein [Methanomassiliicoccaceae archaeon]